MIIGTSHTAIDPVHGHHWYRIASPIRRRVRRNLASLSCRNCIRHRGRGMDPASSRIDGQPARFNCSPMDRRVGDASREIEGHILAVVSRHRMRNSVRSIRRSARTSSPVSRDLATGPGTIEYSRARSKGTNGGSVRDTSTVLAMVKGPNRRLSLEAACRRRPWSSWTSGSDVVFRRNLAIVAGRGRYDPSSTFEVPCDGDLALRRLRDMG